MFVQVTASPRLIGFPGMEWATSASLSNKKNEMENKTERENNDLSPHLFL